MVNRHRNAVLSFTVRCFELIFWFIYYCEDADMKYRILKFARKTKEISKLTKFTQYITLFDILDTSF